MNSAVGAVAASRVVRKVTMPPRTSLWLLSTCPPESTQRVESYSGRGLPSSMTTSSTRSSDRLTPAPSCTSSDALAASVTSQILLNSGTNIRSERDSPGFIGWRDRLCSAAYGPRTSGPQEIVDCCRCPDPSSVSVNLLLITSPKVRNSWSLASVRVSSRSTLPSGVSIVP